MVYAHELHYKYHTRMIINKFHFNEQNKIHGSVIGLVISIKGAYAKFLETLSIFYLSLFMKRIEEENQSFGDHMDITRG